MKLVLAAIHVQPSSRAVPLGPAMLAAAIRSELGAQVETRIQDLYVGRPPEECADLLLACTPDLVGFSMFVWNRALSLEVAAVLRRRRPDLVIFAGGPEVTGDPAGVLAEPAMDFVLPGEGEALIVETLRRLLAGATPRDIAASARPMRVTDLAALPSPYLDGTLDLADHDGGALWELSRGCPFACDFCFESKGDAGLRRFPAERARAELALFAAGGVREVFVLDPTFNYHKVDAKEALRLIAATAPDIHFFFEVRSEFLDREMADLFAAVRCTLQIGLQSAHDEVLRRINRRFDRATFEARVLLLHEAGVAYGFDLIYGLPGDSLQGFRASLDFAASLAPNHLDVFRLSVLPGTRLAETAPALRLEHEARDPYLALASPTFSRADMALAARIARGCDVLYNHGKAVPWFDIILEALQTSASEVFERFAAWLDAHASEDLTCAQRDFVGSLFEERGEPRLGKVAGDIISYFGYSAELMDAPDDEGPSSRRVAFEHDPGDLVALLESGTTRLADLASSLPAMTCEALLSVGADGSIEIDAR